MALPFLPAYIGPGAGFAFLGSFLTLLAGLVMGALSVLLWPFRTLWRLARRGRVYAAAKVHKIIVLGLDGFDPQIAERMMEEGRLPHLAALRARGSYHRLRTTFPALSPVAWSTFATGVHPAKHNIFDFLDRDLRTCMPQLSSARVGQPRRVLKLGRYRIPLSRTPVELRRKSRPFWSILGERGVDCTILRLPITFPPEKFPGRLLSAMCVPDLRGTQGSFSQFTTRVDRVEYENGSRYPLRRAGEWLEGRIEGPADTFEEHAAPIAIPLRLRVLAQGGAELEIDGERYPLPNGEYTAWTTLAFRSALGPKVSGLARFLLTETGDHVSLYMTPIQIDPERPALPISHPAYYAPYLAGIAGPFATAGMAEDTWALNEGVIDHDAFLQQAWDIFAERRAMFLSALGNARRGVVACVFDTSDRVQHMFHRQMNCAGDRHAAVIEEMYARMDALVGETLPFVDRDTALFVLSDHGFRSFRRCVHLNDWLHRHGYLVLREALAEGAPRPFFSDVDWSRTRAYGLGLSGLYLNLRGREQGGIVPQEEAAALRQEIAAGLTALRDDDGQTPIAHVYEAATLYRGPYLNAAPDLIVGYADGYRVSWESALGKLSGSIVDDNPKAWSGDHCVDPLLVPGVLFSNLPLTAENPGIEDMAPTMLDLFGVARPGWMDGSALRV
ncbi:MAG TPA: alkaline phosphatase family protein [Bryobacteraceae bacterium]|jgi:predicted AlkP superfamily phosphohydrolase/phosphomutase|nr:alkaline phosphatase family protein [Bryobacteraceae bacterium]